MRYDNATIPLLAVAVRDVVNGSYVKRTATAKTVYIRGDYDRGTKRYALTDVEDMNKVLYVKPSTLVHIGFTY